MDTEAGFDEFASLSTLLTGLEVKGLAKENPDVAGLLAGASIAMAGWPKRDAAGFDSLDCDEKVDLPAKRSAGAWEGTEEASCFGVGVVEPKGDVDSGAPPKLNAFGPSTPGPAADVLS